MSRASRPLRRVRGAARTLLALDVVRLLGDQPAGLVPTVGIERNGKAGKVTLAYTPGGCCFSNEWSKQ